MHGLVGSSLRGSALVGGLDKLVMLGAHHDGVDTHRTVCGTVVLNRHLTLGIGTQVRHQAAVATYLSQLVHQAVGQLEGERHERRCLIARITEHHALVASALLGEFGTLHATVDVVALLMQRAEHAARLAVEFQLTVVVANLGDYVASRGHQVDIGFAFHFAGNNHLAGGHQRFTRHLRRRVEGEKLVQDGIANLVGNLVGMPFRDRFRSKQVIHFSNYLKI